MQLYFSYFYSVATLQKCKCAKVASDFDLRSWCPSKGYQIQKKLRFVFVATSTSVTTVRNLKVQFFYCLQIYVQNKYLDYIYVGCRSNFMLSKMKNHLIKQKNATCAKRMEKDKNTCNLSGISAMQMARLFELDKEPNECNASRVWSPFWSYFS